MATFNFKLSLALFLILGLKDKYQQGAVPIPVKIKEHKFQVFRDKKFTRMCSQENVRDCVFSRLIFLVTCIKLFSVSII